MSYPAPRPPHEIKTPPTSIGIYEFEGGARRPQPIFPSPMSRPLETENPMNLITFGAVCGILALIIVLVVLL